MPLVIYGLGGVHTYMHTHTHAYTRTLKVISRNQACGGGRLPHSWFNYVKQSICQEDACKRLCDFTSYRNICKRIILLCKHFMQKYCSCPTQVVKQYLQSKGTMDGHIK